ATQTKPDFSGVWTLVADKSDFGEMPAPATMTRTITHKDPALTIVVAQTGGEGDATLPYNSPDGQTTKQVKPAGKPSSSKRSGFLRPTPRAPKVAAPV